MSMIDGSKSVSKSASESASEKKRYNKYEIQWFIRRLKNYMFTKDEPLIEELNKLMKDPFIEDIDENIIKNYKDKVENTIQICNVLDRFPVKKIESYIRKKKLDILNRNNGDMDEIDPYCDVTGC